VTPDIVARGWGACNLRKIPAVLREAYCRDWTSQTSAGPSQQKHGVAAYIWLWKSVYA